MRAILGDYYPQNQTTWRLDKLLINNVWKYYRQIVKETAIK